MRNSRPAVPLEMLSHREHRVVIGRVKKVDKLIVNSFIESFRTRSLHGEDKESPGHKLGHLFDDNRTTPNGQI
jgi:hypothetical protein